MAALPGAIEGLLQCSAVGDVNGVRRLLLPQPQHPALLDAANSDGVTPVMLAAKAGHVGVVALLLQRGASVHTRTRLGNTAMHWACHAGNPLLVHLLMKFGASVAVANANGDTPLMWACVGGHGGVVRVLVEQEPSQVPVRNKDGLDALMCVCRSAGSGVSTIQVLLDAAKRQGLHLVSQQDRNGNSALHICISLGKEEEAGLLLDHGADLHLENRKAQTPLSMSTRQNSCEEVVQQFLSKQGRSALAAQRELLSMDTATAEEEDGGGDHAGDGSGDDDAVHTQDAEAKQQRDGDCMENDSVGGDVAVADEGGAEDAEVDDATAQLYASRYMHMRRRLSALGGDVVAGLDISPEHVFGVDAAELSPSQVDAVHSVRLKLIVQGSRDDIHAAAFASLAPRLQQMQEQLCIGLEHIVGVDLHSLSGVQLEAVQRLHKDAGQRIDDALRQHCAAVVPHDGQPESVEMTLQSIEQRLARLSTDGPTGLWLGRRGTDPT